MLQNSEGRLETPCVNVCMLDDASGLCVGCGRSGAEIAGWVDMSPAERRAIMAARPERMRQLEQQTANGEAAS